MKSQPTIMKGAFIALVIGIVLLLLLYFGLDIYSRKNMVNIHLHDTYFVLNYASVFLFLLLFLGTFFTIGGIIGSQFKSKLFWILALFFITIDTYYFLTYYNAFNGMEATSILKT